MPGYVYAILFTNKRVKVGKTNNVERRFAEHRRSATGHGVKFRKTWHLEVGDPAQVERELHRVAYEAGGHAVLDANEFFTQLDYPFFIEMAMALYGGAPANDRVRDVLAATDCDLTIPEDLTSSLLPDA